MIIHSMPEGTTEQQVFTLKADGSAINLDGYSVSMEATDKSGTAINPGTVSIVTAAEGKVKLMPSDEWKRTGSPYSVRWVVTNDIDRFKVPNSVQPDQWQVPKP